MRDSLTFCFLTAVLFFAAVKKERLYAEREELKAEEAKFVYHLTRANLEIDFTIKRFQQLKKTNQRLQDYCTKYNYRGWVSYDNHFFFPCQMLKPKNKIRAFDLAELRSDMDTASLTSNKLQ